MQRTRASAGHAPTPARAPALSDLRAFVAAAELRSFAAAANALHLSFPAFSRRISNLEQRLGVRLLDRTTRSVELTVLGARFLREARSVIEDLDRSVRRLREAAEDGAGDVTIACVFSAAQHFLPAVIRAYRQRHPNVLVRIVEQGADGVVASVRHGEAEFGINYIGMQESDLEFTTLMKERYILACASDHPLARRRSIRWSELARWDHLRVWQANRNRVLIDETLAGLPPLPQPICEVRHVFTLIGLVEAGLGVAIVPQLAAPRRPATVVGVPLVEPTVTRTIGIIRQRGRSLSPAAEAFAKLLMETSRAGAGEVRSRPRKPRSN